MRKWRVVIDQIELFSQEPPYPSMRFFSSAISSLIVSAVVLAGTKCGLDEKRYIRVSACTHKHVIHLHTYHVSAPTVEVELPIYMLRLGCSWAHFAYLRTWFHTFTP